MGGKLIDALDRFTDELIYYRFIDVIIQRLNHRTAAFFEGSKQSEERGQSITDACMGWEATVDALATLAAASASRTAARSGMPVTS